MPFNGRWPAIAGHGRKWAPTLGAGMQGQPTQLTPRPHAKLVQHTEVIQTTCDVCHGEIKHGQMPGFFLAIQGNSRGWKFLGHFFEKQGLGGQDGLAV